MTTIRRPHSNNRFKPQRHSVLMVDMTESSEDIGSLSRGSSEGSSFSSPFASASSSYNAHFLNDLHKNGMTICADEVYILRREFREDYRRAGTSREKRAACIEEAINTLNSLYIHLLHIKQTDSSKLSFFIYEYQSFLCWVYSTIRGAEFSTGLQRHFNNLKNHHQLLFENIPIPSEEYLLAVLRFSYIALEYGPFCDVTTLQICREAYQTVSASVKSSQSIATDITASRDKDRLLNLQKDLHRQIKQLEECVSHSLSLNAREKLII